MNIIELLGITYKEDIISNLIVGLEYLIHKASLDICKHKNF